MGNGLYAALITAPAFLVGHLAMTLFILHHADATPFSWGAMLTAPALMACLPGAILRHMRGRPSFTTVPAELALMCAQILMVAWVTRLLLPYGSAYAALAIVSGIVVVVIDILALVERHRFRRWVEEAGGVVDAATAKVVEIYNGGGDDPFGDIARHVAKIRDHDQLHWQVAEAMEDAAVRLRRVLASRARKASAQGETHATATNPRPRG